MRPINPLLSGWSSLALLGEDLRELVVLCDACTFAEGLDPSTLSALIAKTLLPTTAVLVADKASFPASLPLSAVARRLSRTLLEPWMAHPDVVSDDWA